MLRHDLAVLSGLVGVACAIAFAVAVVTEGEIGLRILLFMPVASLAMVVGDRKTRYATPPAWLAGFSTANVSLSVLGVYLTWLSQTMDGLAMLVPLSVAFVAFLCVSILTPLVLMRGLRERRTPPAVPAAVNFRSSHGPA